jgi:photosystem II stability/assembly factor-like uncharacterized protein
MSWSNHVEPLYDLDDAACSSQSSCVALGVKIAAGSNGEIDAGLLTSNGGRTWTPISFPARKLSLGSVTCTAPAICLAVGTNTTQSTGLVYRSVNGGRSWSPVRLPSNAKAMHSVSCTGMVCIATSTSFEVAISENGGRSWVIHKRPISPAIQDGSCMSSKVCVMVGFSGSPARPVAQVTHNGGSTWTTQTLPRFDGSLASVDCLPTYCVAVGVRVVYRGAKATAEFPEILTY